MNDIKVKYCPFCGGKAQLDISIEDNRTIMVFVECENCKCRRGRDYTILPSVKAERLPRITALDRLEEALFEVAAWWNERPEMPDEQGRRGKNIVNEQEENNG